MQTMPLNIIGPRIGKNEKNEHTFKITYRDQLKDYDWPDLQKHGEFTYRIIYIYFVKQLQKRINI